MKTIIIIITLILIGCATTNTTTPPTETPESFEKCMRYNENIVLTPKEELKLFDYCVGLSYGVDLDD